MEELVATPEAREARAHHEQDQLVRGDHPHDHGRYIQPPLVWSARRPIVARYRTILVDLSGWNECPPLDEVVRVEIVLKPAEGESVALAAGPCDQSRRRYDVQLPAEAALPGWLPSEIYGVQVRVWTTDDSLPHTWAPLVEDRDVGKHKMTVEILDEPRRPCEPRREPV
jgi:hypothetical protein